MSELIIYEGILSNEDTAAVESYLGSRIPEPSALVIAVIGVLGCGGFRRRA